MELWNKIVHDKYEVDISVPETYVDNQKRGRSGHMTHALCEIAPDTIVDFNSNCSPIRFRGHSAYGWVEYRISKDAGVTYSEPYIFPFSKKSFEDGIFSVSVEKAVCCDDGTVVVTCLRNDMLGAICCEPWFTPYICRSTDGCKTWEEAYELSPFAGRVYDALYKDGAIYIVLLCNDARKPEKHEGGLTESFCASRPEDVYRIYKSTDSGRSFSELCVVPMESTFGRAYATMLFDEKGNLHFYTYNSCDEVNMDHLVSPDNGMTWETVQPCYLEKGIRNPQANIIDGIYVLHGRAKGFKGFVFYTSEDGYTWDEGVYLETEKKQCYYSNNLVVNDPDGGKRLLVQFSDTYEEARVNVMHMWAKVKIKN